VNILFICKHNRFRSKIAEAFFNKYINKLNDAKINKDKKEKNKIKKHKARSRGVIKDIDVAENVIRVSKEKGIKLSSKKSVKLAKEDIKWANVIIIVANNVNINSVCLNKEDLKGKKIIKWKISDINQGDYEGILKRAEAIEKRIKKLVSILE